MNELLPPNVHHAEAVSIFTGEPYDPSWGVQVLPYSYRKAAGDFYHIKAWNTSEFEMEDWKQDGWIDVPFWFAWLCWSGVAVPAPLGLIYWILSWYVHTTAWIGILSFIVVCLLIGLVSAIVMMRQHNERLAQRSIVKVDVPDYYIHGVKEGVHNYGDYYN